MLGPYSYSNMNVFYHKDNFNSLNFLKKRLKKLILESIFQFSIFESNVFRTNTNGVFEIPALRDGKKWGRQKSVRQVWVKLCCDCRFQRAFTACSCVFKVITLVGSNQGNYFENATACSKRTLKTTVVTQLNVNNELKEYARHCVTI